VRPALWPAASPGRGAQCPIHSRREIGHPVWLADQVLALQAEPIGAEIGVTRGIKDARRQTEFACCVHYIDSTQSWHGYVGQQKIE
jgi:hypothetical protein